MSIKRMTKEELHLSLGALNPVGHSVLAFDDDSAAAEAAAELERTGFSPEDVLLYTAKEVKPQLGDLVEQASEMVGFGPEITLLRRYSQLALNGAGWLVVYTPEDEAASRLVDVSERLGVRSAVRYQDRATEDLLTDS